MADQGTQGAGYVTTLAFSYQKKVIVEISAEDVPRVPDRLPNLLSGDLRNCSPDARQVTCYLSSEISHVYSRPFALSLA